MTKVKNNIQIYKSVNHKDYTLISLKNLFTSIKSGVFFEKDLTSLFEKIRTTNDKKERSDLKKKLPCTLTSAYTKQNKDKTAQNVYDYTNLVQIDIDESTLDYEVLKQIVFKDKHILAAFRSPSNKLKALFACEYTKENFKDIFEQIKEYFSINYSEKLDVATSNINRLMYVSYDKNILYKQTNEVEFFQVDYAKIAAKKQAKERKTVQYSAKVELNNVSDYVEKKALENKIKQVINTIYKTAQNSVQGQIRINRLKMSTLIGGLVGANLLSNSEAFNIVYNAFSFSDTSAKAKKAIVNGIKNGENQPFSRARIVAEYVEYLETHKSEKHKLVVKKKIEKINYNKTLSIQKYLSEKESIIFDLIEQKQKILIASGTGTGKTTLMLRFAEKAIRENKKMLFVAPLTTIVNQLSNNEAISKNKNFAVITGKSSKLDKESAFYSDVVFCTYELFEKYAKDRDYLVIDEIHNFIDSYNFRAQTIKKISIEVETTKQKIIALTGTPNSLIIKHYKFFAIKVDATKIKDKKVKVIKAANSVKNTIKQILNSLKTNQKNIIFVNDTKIINYAYNYLVNNKIAKKSEVLKLYSDRKIKNGKEYQRLADTSLLSEKTKIVLTTAILKEGVNINNSDINNVYYIANNYHENINDLIQSLARVRNYDNTNFFYYAKIAKEHTKEYINESYLYDTEIQAQKIEVNELNKAQKEDYTTNIRFTSAEHKYITSIKTVYYVDSLKLMFDSFNMFLNSLSIYDFIEYANANFNVHFKLVNETINESEEESEVKTDLSILKNLVEHKPKAFISFMNSNSLSKEVHKFTKSLNITNLDASILNESEVNFLNENTKESKEVVKRIMTIYKEQVHDLNTENQLYTTEKNTLNFILNSTFSEKENEIQLTSNSNFFKQFSKIQRFKLLLFDNEKYKLNAANVAKKRALQKSLYNVNKQISKLLSTKQLLNYMNLNIDTKIFPQYENKTFLMTVLNDFFEYEVVRKRNSKKEQVNYIKIIKQKDIKQELTKAFYYSNNETYDKTKKVA